LLRICNVINRFFIGGLKVEPRANKILISIRPDNEDDHFFRKKNDEK